MLSFGNSLFLFALAGLAIPILLHLINRELAVNLKFPSVRFIRRTQLPRREKRRLRDLLLLLLRLLLYSAIVLAFARPVWIEPVAEAGESTDLRETVYLVDASASMSGGNRWQESLEKLRSDVSNTDTGAIGLVVYADRVLSQIPPAPGVERVENALSDLKPSFAAGQPASALETATRLFRPEAEKRLVIVSDFQETDWQRDLPGVPEDVELVFLAPGIGELPNVGIVNVNTVPVGKDRARVLVTLRNYGRENQSITLTLSGDSLELEKPVELPAGQVGSASFSLEVVEPVGVRATLPADSYQADNTWHFWVAPPPVIRAYAFLPNLDEPQAVNAFYFLRTALEVESESDWVRFEVTSLDRGFFDASTLEDADVVLLPASAAYIRDEQWEDLRAYLAKGRTAIMLPGEGFPKQFRSLERTGFMQSRFLGLAGNTNERQKPYHIASIHPSSRLAQTFSDAAAKDLFLVNVYRYVRLQASEADTVALAFENGEPALLALSVGQGTLYASTFAFEPGWTDLPLRNSFLPLVRELVQEGFDTDRLRLQMFVEELGELPEVEPVPAAFQQDGRFWEVNVNPSESVAARVDIEEWLPALLSQKPLYASQSSRAETQMASEASQIPLWPWLLMIALLCLFLESLLTGMKDVHPSSNLQKTKPA